MRRDQEVVGTDWPASLPEHMANLAVVPRRIDAEGQNLQIVKKAVQDPAVLLNAP